MTQAQETLLEKALRITMTEEQARAQRLSFAYGNTHIENTLITREMIEEADARLEEEERRGGEYGMPHGG